MEFIEVSAKTVDDAITKACIELQAASDKLEIQVISEGSSGFFGIGSKPAIIKARKVDDNSEEKEIEKMERVLDMLRFKCWYYEQAIKDGSEDRLKTLIPDHLPDGIRKAYENAHR